VPREPPRYCFRSLTILKRSAAALFSCNQTQSISETSSLTQGKISNKYQSVILVSATSVEGIDKSRLAEREVVEIANWQRHSAEHADWLALVVAAFDPR